MDAIFRARAPLRLGLAGGGTDVSPYSDEFGGFVLNATIDLYAHAILEPCLDGHISFYAEDLNESAVFYNTNVLPDINPLRLHKGVYNSIVRRFCDNKPLSFKLTTYADAPSGSGLGTSSTMVVCIIKVFSEWLNLGLDDYAIANLAYEIEREELMLAGGKQDQYAAAFGGFNFMEFGPNKSKVLVNPLRIKEWILNELETSTILYYTGQSRESSKIIEQQIRNTNSKTSISIEAMNLLKRDAVEMKEAILMGRLNEYATILHRSWQSKKKLSENISNPWLDSIYSDVMSAGALAGKISGAGGGGFFMFFVPPKKRISIIQKLKRHQGELVNFHFISKGVESWVTSLGY